MRHSLKLAALLLAAPLLLPAQSTFGTMLGTVSDTSGSVVPNAKIVITNGTAPRQPSMDDPRFLREQHDDLRKR